MRLPFMKTNGNSNGAPAMYTEAGRVASTAENVLDGCQAIARTGEKQLAIIESAIAASGTVSHSLRETAEQARSVSTSSEELVSSVNELAASIEQLSGGSSELASSITETAASVEETGRAIANFAMTARTMSTIAMSCGVTSF